MTLKRSQESYKMTTEKPQMGPKTTPNSLQNRQKIFPKRPQNGLTDDLNMILKRSQNDPEMTPRSPYNDSKKMLKTLERSQKEFKITPERPKNSPKIYPDRP